MTMLLTQAGYVPATSVGQPTHELALHEAVLRAAPMLLPKLRFTRVAVHEFTIRGARPDVFVADVNIALLETRICEDMPPLSSTAETAVRAAFSTGRTLRDADVVDLASRYTPVATAQRALRRLCAAGYVIEQRGALQLHEAFLPAVHRTVGVEAKLGKWRSTVAQARKWRLRFDQAYLAFPESYAAKLSGDLPGLTAFGVLGVVPNGVVEKTMSPPARRADAFNRVLIEEWFFARLLAENRVQQFEPLSSNTSLAAA
jgi:hypothetical protein